MSEMALMFTVFIVLGVYLLCWIIAAEIEDGYAAYRRKARYNLTKLDGPWGNK